MLIFYKIGSILKDKNFKKIDYSYTFWQKPSEFINSRLEAKRTFANFILIKISKKKFKKRIILKKLLKNKILIRDLESYGLSEFIRVSIGTNEQMNKFKKILKTIMKNNDVNKY